MKSRAITYFSDAISFERVTGALPCSCGHELATIEKQGRCVGPNCATLLTGREFPLRKGNETSRLVSFRTERSRIDV